MLKNLPPGPAQWESTLMMKDFRHDRLSFFQNLQKNHGNVVFFHLGTQPVVLVNEPDIIQRILTRDNAQFKKGRFLELAKDLLGEGLLTSEGEHHKRQRQIIQPMFHRKMIHGYAEIMVKYAERLNQRLAHQHVFDLNTSMMNLTLAIVGQTLFDADVESESSAIGESMEVFLESFKMMGHPLAIMLRKWNTPARRRFLKAKAVLDTEVYRIIEKHRHSAEPTPNLIQMLLQAKNEAGECSMSDLQIRDEALTLFLAGHETTANALIWTWYLLSQHPRVEALFHKELQQVLQGETPTMEHLSALKYTRALLKESMRLYPPAWIQGRKALNDYSLNEHYAIPQGCVVIMSQYIMHRSPRYYQDPERFLPERWEKDLDRPKFSYFPFSGGPRNCVGEAFAWMEGILILATLGQKWRFELEPGQKVELLPLVTLRPKHEIKMKAVSRVP